VQTDLTGADLTGCRIYGLSAWKLKLGIKQQNLVITGYGEPEITVDNLEVVQFIYLLLHNEKIRDVIDTITSKAVLILGRFTNDRQGFSQHANFQQQLIRRFRSGLGRQSYVLRTSLRVTFLNVIRARSSAVAFQATSPCLSQAWLLPFLRKA
jgi:hypothetical protein